MFARASLQVYASPCCFEAQTKSPNIANKKLDKANHVYRDFGA